VRLEGLGKLKHFTDLTGNQIRDLLTFSIVPEPTRKSIIVLSLSYAIEQTTKINHVPKKYKLINIIISDIFLDAANITFR
jgi:hypothetical protein